MLPSIRVARTVQSRIGGLADGISGRKFFRTRILTRTSKLPDGILIFETVAWRRHGEKKRGGCPFFSGTRAGKNSKLRDFSGALKYMVNELISL
jgi:hypothetical protein